MSSLELVIILATCLIVIIFAGCCFILSCIGFLMTFRKHQPMRIQPIFYGSSAASIELSACIVWPTRELDQIKAMDAVPAVLVPLGSLAQREWLAKNTKETYRAVLFPAMAEQGLRNNQTLLWNS